MDDQGETAPVRNDSPRRSRRRGAWLAFIGTVAALVPGARGAEVTVPGAIQATMAVRILEYDRALKGWSGGTITIGIVSRRSGAAADFAQAFAGRQAQDVPIRVAEYVLKDLEGLRAWQERSNVRLLYLAPDLASETAAAIAAGTERRIPSLVATRPQFQEGATLGIVVRDGKPHILVNLKSARAFGMDLDPKLLQLAEVVR